METLEAAGSLDRALVFGIGGGGDVVSTIPTARLLERLGVEVLVGGVTWIPVPRDTRPGPRPIDELVDIERLAPRVGRVSPTTATVDGVSLAETTVAGSLDIEVLALDVSAGVDPLAASLTSVAEARDIDLVVGVDAGGDVLALGDEPGLRSPLTDAVGLGVLSQLDVETLLGVLGYGSDGELTHDELAGAFQSLAAAGGYLGAWGITPQTRHELEHILESVETEASRLPVEAAAGLLGERSIRGGRREVFLTPASTVTYYFDPAVVIERSTLVGPVAQAATLEAAADALRRRGLQTEFDLEQARLDER